MALVWVLYAFVELFLYLPLLSGAFLAYAQVWETDPLPAAFWWRDIGSAIGNLADLSPSSQTTFMVAWVILALLMLVGPPSVGDAQRVCTSLVSAWLIRKDSAKPSPGEAPHGGRGSPAAAVKREAEEDWGKRRWR